ncbi:hypothetical protein FSW04_05215 [Baekduia soli]|uniref:Uncharacterized protein n=1 Tax=Baekduia soli TaxID=496014 RepID=A0A5B8U221_9ACTN|nr:hypothetical protein [Baekduia soli]QEC47043.1 hypothetical protein FSW04_05215 [Baekduia soli]
MTDDAWEARQRAIARDHAIPPTPGVKPATRPQPMNPDEVRVDGVRYPVIGDEEREFRSCGGSFRQLAGSQVPGRA